MHPWLDPLFDAPEMRAVDAWAIEDQGVPSLDLMERAGEGLARVTAAAARPGPIRVVVGKGNNGGDGLVVARLLRADGHEVDVLSIGALDELKGDALANLQRLPGRPPEPFAPQGLEASGAVVDALLGTGFAGTPREPLASAIAAINAQDAPVVACDMPSGVDASSGEVEGEAVRAAVTATFHAPKLGLYVNPGKVHAGRVEVVEIGAAARDLMEQIAAADRLLERAQAERGQDLAHLLGDEAEQVDHLVGRALELLAQVGALGADAHRAGIGVALADQDAAHRDQRRGTDAELLGAEHRRDHHVAAGFDAAVSA